MTMEPLAERISSLSPEHRRLLELRLRKQESGLTKRSIPKRRQENYCPLSLDQERIWFIQQLDPDSPAYNIYSANRFSGDLNVALLKRSLNEVVRRHEIMRTAFEVVDGKPVQVIAPELHVDLPLIDLRTFPHEQREREAEQITSRLVQSPFDLTKLPLFQSLLVQLDEQSYVCATVFHHLITDWVSFHIFERELALLYEAFLHGRPSPLPELPIQYADFAVWQRQWLADEAISIHIDYWRRQLEGAQLTLELPRDRQRPLAQTPWGRRQPLVLSKTHSDALRNLARQEEATLFITMLAVFKVLLFRITGQERLIVGSPIANRNEGETEELLGFFINQLALCTDLSGNPTFREALRRVRETALGAYAHQDMPFGKLVEELQPERALSHTPLTQVVFLFLNPQDQGIVKFANLNVLPYTVDGESSKFDMTLSLWDNDTGFAGWIEYNTDLFDTSTIIRMGEQFRTLAACIAANPDQRIGELQILSESARHQLLIEWRATDAPPPDTETCVHQLFEKQAAQTPDAVAIVCGDEQVTYRELNERADSLSQQLRELNVGPETPVAILMERGSRMIVAMLAILKAGGAYLPIDPTEPAERVAFMLKDAGVGVLISETGLSEHQSASNVRFPEKNFPANLAYVIYTSGSTGKPKGVAIEHRSLVNLVKWHQRTYDVKPEDRATLLAGTAFDASVWEVWPYLTAGASVYIPDEHTRSSVVTLIEWLATSAITISFMPTPLAEVALEEQWPKNMALRYLLTGGAALHHPQPAKAPFQFFNHYGPTENTVVATAGRVEVQPGVAPSIGRPIAGVEVYLLDRNLQPVPAGVAGEICIGGAGLARGYLNHPALTGAAFVPNPFSTQPGARLYRTGDLARYRHDGRIEFLGRLDHQVKMRGFRIELGEIENVLNECNEVSESLVLAREDVPGQKRLAAYVVSSNPDLKPATLREYLSQRLPEYMVPSTFVLLEKFPLTRNGKIDTTLLPVPERNAAGNEQPLAGPRTEREAQLVEIWSQVLGIDGIGIHDNFFELGGDSILSIQIIARARKLGLHFAPKQIFLHQTIAELAAVAISDAALAAEQGMVTGEIPLTPIQQRFFAQELPEPHHFNQALLLELRAGVKPHVLEQAVTRVFAHHDMLHVRFFRDGNSYRQHSAPPEEQPFFTTIDLSATAGSLAATATELQQSLDLFAGPLARVALIDEGKSNWLFILVHHLVIDAVSWRILLEDLQHAYEQIDSGGQIVLPAKTTSYKRWAERLTEYAHSAEVQEQLELWTADAQKHVEPLPVDHPDGENTAAVAQSVQVQLTEEETRELLQDAPAAYRAHIDEILLAALVLGFRELTGEPQLIVDLEGHGREEIFEEVDVSRTVGWFTSVYPVVLDIGEAKSTTDSIKLVKEQLRRFPARGIGYGLLRYLSPDDKIRTELRDLPQAQVSFNYLGQLDQSLPANSFIAGAAAAPGNTRSPRGRRSYLFEIDGSVVDGRFSLQWIYSEQCHERATVERLAHNYITALREIIANRDSEAARAYTLSDFPLAKLDPTRLEWLVNTYPQLEDVYRLSSIQQGLLFHTLSAPQSGAYTEQLRCELSGNLDLHAFEEAWQAVLERHSILRTSFVWSGFDEPLQIVHRRVRLELNVQDLRELAPAEQSEYLEKFLSADREQGFDPAQAPLVRLSLFRTGVENYHCVWSLHHLLLDGWSIPLVLHEVMDHYTRLAAGKQLRKQTARPFRDYIKWLESHDPATDEQYWRQVLKGFKSPTSLGADYFAGHAAREREYSDEIFQLSASETEQLQQLARHSQLTLNTLIQGAWGILLSQYSEREDVLFGVTTSGRPVEIAGIEKMVGLFINTLPVRLLVTPEASVLSWLKQLQVTQVEMRQHEYSPLMQQWSDVPSGRQLFESLLVFENYPMDGFLKEKSARLKIRGMQVLVRTQYPLTLVAMPGAELFFNVAYDRQRFSSSTISSLLEHLRLLLVSIAAQPDQTIAVLALPPRLYAEKREQALTSVDYVPPGNPVEEMVAGIWTELLGIERIGSCDNFFELGGHSLIATQIVSRIRDTFKVEFSIRELLEAMTVAEQARRIQDLLRANTASQSLPIRPVPRDGKLPVSLAQEPIWQLDQLLPGNPFFNVPAIFRLFGPLRVEVLERALEEIANRHEILRTTFSEVDGEPVQVINPSSSLKLGLIDLRDLSLAEQEDEVSRLAAADAKRSFDLNTGPLLRVTLLRIGKEEYTALITMHHIISDMWAVGIFVRELATLYEAFCKGHSSPLPPLAVQYADYAVWQREWLQGDVLADQLEFWKQQLSGPLAPLNLPSDYPRTEELTFKTAVQTVRLPQQLSAQIRSASRAEGITLFMTLLAALQILLYRYTQQVDIRVGTLIANRNRAETEDLIGLFINTLVMRTILAPAASFREVLHQVRGVVLEAFNHQDLPFEVLVHRLEDEQQLKRTSLIDVLFIFQNAPVQPLQLTDLTVIPADESRFGQEVTLTSFDLVVIIWDGADSLEGSIRYKTSVFRDETIVRMLDDLQTILTGIVFQPEQQI